MSTDDTLVRIGRFELRFQCQQGCTACCEQPGEVYLVRDDRKRLAERLGLTVRELERRYCRRDDEGDWVLATPDDKACHFLGDGVCTVHEVKPLQCRTFPFWPENVRTKSAWTRVAGYCPGIGEGGILPVEAIRPALQETARAFPELEG